MGMRLRNNIRKLRIARGKKLCELIAYLKPYSKQAIINWEKNNFNPTPKIRKKVLAFLKATEEEVFYFGL